MSETPSPRAHRNLRTAVLWAGTLACWLAGGMAATVHAQTPAAGERPLPPAPVGATPALPVASAAPAAVAPSAAASAPPRAADISELWAAFQKVGVKESEVALLAQPLAAGSPLLVSHNEKLAFTLASTTKVITTLASLQTLPGS